MRKSTASAVLITAVGFSALTVAPASAAVLPFPNCDAAAAVGVYNIPVGTPGYGAHLDSDSDGVGCENPGAAYDPGPVQTIINENQQPPVTREQPRLEELPPNTGIVVGPESPQVEQMPVGGADTGVAVEPAGANGAAVIAGGLALAAAAGGLVLMRRRTRSS